MSSETVVTPTKLQIPPHHSQPPVDWFVVLCWIVVWNLCVRYIELSVLFFIKLSRISLRITFENVQCIQFYEKWWFFKCTHTWIWDFFFGKGQERIFNNNSVKSSVFPWNPLPGTYRTRVRAAFRCKVPFFSGRRLDFRPESPRFKDATEGGPVND